MKILLIGGTGTLSSDTTLLCVERKYDVYLFNRGKRNEYNSFSNLHYIVGDINNLHLAKTLLEGYVFDVIVDYLTYDLETLKKRIQLFQNHTQQYIFISSATVFSINRGSITETSEKENNGWLYAQNKLMCEKYLEEHQQDLPFYYTIVRPYITYGISRIPFPVISKTDNWNLVYRIQNKLPILMCGDGNQIMTLTHTRDFAVGIAGLFMNSKAMNEDFNIIGDCVSTWNDVIQTIEKIVNQKARIVFVSTKRLAESIPELSEELIYDKAFSHIFNNEKIKGIVKDYRPSITIERGLGETVENLIRLHKDGNNIDEKWNCMENYLCAKYSRIYKASYRDAFIYYMYSSQTAYLLKRILKSARRKR